jgi:hypothetical protein
MFLNGVPGNHWLDQLTARLPSKWEGWNFEDKIRQAERDVQRNLQKGNELMKRIEYNWGRGNPAMICANFNASDF